MTNYAIQDQIRGMALGSAIGDALGMPLEFKNPPIIPVVNMIKGRLPAGSFTDDTEMAIALAEVYMGNRGRFNAYDAVRRWDNWLRRRPSDVGSHTSGALMYARRVQSQRGNLYEAAEKFQQRNAGSAGNGSIMRMWPAIAANWRNYALAVKEAGDQGRLTHPHGECQAATRFLALLCWKLIQGYAFDYCVTSAIDESVIPEELQIAIGVALNATGHDKHLFPSTGWVRDTVMTALWACNVTRCFEDALVLAVNQGNDADTIGAVTGMIAGAAWGLSKIPSEWREAVKGRWPIHGPHVWTDADLIAVADRLARF